MCFLYVIRHGAVLGISGGLLTVRYPDASEESVPKNLIEGISIYARVVLTTQCIEFCLSNNIRVGFFSSSGTYKGCLSPIENCNTSRLRKQIELSDDAEFSLQLSKRIVCAKIINQSVIIRRHSQSKEDSYQCVHAMYRIAKQKIPAAQTINQIIGYEGIASRRYFDWISQHIDAEFAFDKRNRRPAKDPFNRMINYGYSLLHKEIYGEIENRQLNPFIGFIHRDKVGHASLASDLIEEWRAVIVDSTVLSIIQRHEIRLDDFVMENGKCIMSKDALKVLITKLEQKMETKMSYLKYVNKPVTFREALWHQADRLSRVIDGSVPERYVPIIIR